MYNNYITDNNRLQGVLEDYKLVNGKRKRIKWEVHKDSATKLADSYSRLGLHSKANRVDSCGNYLVFSVADDGLHLQHAKFCKVRLCPMCAWRRSLKIFAQTSKIMDCYDRLNPTHKYIFLTLTCRNVSGDLLAGQIDLLVTAWRKLAKSDVFKQYVNGWFRALEVTHNLQTDTYHPHYHCILAVPNSYFQGYYYMSQAKWVQLWRNCMGVDYDPIVDVRLLRGGKSGVSEASKYAAKPTDYLIVDDYYNVDTVQTDRAVAVLDSALRSRRLIAYGGEFKRLHKALDLDDTETCDLVHIDDDSVRADVGQALYIYHWHVGYRRYTLTDVIQSDGGDDDV